jgi:shikimate dehydrogenase
MIRGSTRVFAVLGRPVAHSLSPALHNAWLTRHALDAVYVALEVAPEVDLRGLVRTSGLAGVNLTAPLKRAGLAVADHLTDAARATGAVNTLSRDGDRWLGDNTDVAGFRAALGDPPAGPILVLGAGGSAAAVRFALAGSALTVLNRTPSAGVAALDRETFCALAPGASLVVNCTGPGATASLRRWAAEAHVEPSRWFDLNYWDPVLAGRGEPGLAMLAAQAAAAFTRFTGIALGPAEVAHARAAAVPRDGAPC